jgi:hypothetical protein
MSGFTAKEQFSSSVGQQGLRMDEDPSNNKAPLGDLNKSQRIGNAGETVPIVFTKRVVSAFGPDVGGVWVQPPMVKTASNEFVGSFLYAISQGEIVSTPEKYLAWVGLRNLQYIEDQTITLTHYYSSAAAMAAAPNACPLTGGEIYCGIDSTSYLAELQKAEVGAVYTHRLDYASRYHNSLTITRGTGDTTNSVMFVAQTDFSIYDNATGADLTAAYWAALSITPSPTSYFVFNADIVGSVLVGGKAVGYIGGLPVLPLTAPNAFYFTIGATGDGSVTEVYTMTIVDNQVNIANPPSTGTLDGVQREFHYSNVTNPSTPPSTEDYTAFADITFLQVDGNIYDPPDAGSYPTTTQQLYIFYEEGVEVDLYSGGLVGGSYAKGASNHFVDLAMYLFTIYKRAEGAATPELAAPIYVDNLPDIASFCENYEFYFNGIIAQSVNIIDYIASIAPFFTLILASVGGQYQLLPALPLDGSNEIDLSSLTPVATFTDDDIIPGTFDKTYASADDRRDIQVALIWREYGPEKIGIQRTTTIRFADTANDAPVVQFDMSDFCASEAHANSYGAFELVRRKYSTHTISFGVPLLTIALKPTDIIKIDRQRVSSKGDNRSEVEWYQVSGIKHTTAGVTIVEASHFPVDGSDVSVICDQLLNGSYLFS